MPGSDVDILIVLQTDSRRFVDRILHYLDVFEDIGLATDIFPYTIEELNNQLAKTAMRSGKILFER